MTTHALVQRVWRNRMAYAFVLPSLVFLLALIVIPLLRSAQISFTRWDGILPPEFIGFRNYGKLVRDVTFWRALANNLRFTAIVTTFTVGLGFLFAVAIDRRVPGWRVYKFVYYIPVMISMTVVGLLFQKIYEPTNGILNSFLGAIGLGGLRSAWLGNPDIVLYSVIAVTIWHYSGFTMLLFLNAVEGISPELHDAATIDGVNGFQRITRVILPLVSRLMFAVTMLQIIFSFKVFDGIYIMTQGGPGDASQVLGTYLYEIAFAQFNFGYASTVAVVMAAIVFTFTLVYLHFSRLGEHATE